MMLTFKMPFKIALDPLYQGLMKDPKAHLAKYGRELSEEAIDLILGMLCENPLERYTIE